MMNNIMKHITFVLFFQLLTFSLNLNTDQLTKTEYPNSNVVIEEFIQTKEGEEALIKNNNFVIKVFENTEVSVMDINNIDVHNGVVMFFNKNKYTNEEIKNISIDEELFISNDEGKFQFYRIKLPKVFKNIDTDIEIIYNLFDDKKEIQTELHPIFATKDHKYYGTFIPFNIYWENISYRVNLSIYSKNDIFVKLSKMYSVNDIEWEKQTIYFKKSKSKELQSANKSLYYDEHKKRIKIWSENNHTYFFRNGFNYPLIDHQYITSDFGLIREWRLYNRRLYSRSTHIGVDMAHLKNTVIYSPADGIVRYAQHGELVGNTMIIEHGLGLFTDYSHMEKTLVQPGTKIKKGDIIGLVGATGAATGSHLHWGARVLGFPVDPKTLIGIEEIFVP